MYVCALIIPGAKIAGNPRSCVGDWRVNW